MILLLVIGGGAAVPNGFVNWNRNNQRPSKVSLRRYAGFWTRGNAVLQCVGEQFALIADRRLWCDGYGNLVVAR